MADLDVEADVQRLARELLPHTSALAATIGEEILQRIPELALMGSADAVRAVHESTEQNVGAILATLAFGVPAAAIEPPGSTLELLSQLLAAGGAVTDLFRAYYLGQEMLRRQIEQHVHVSVSDPARQHAVVNAVARHLFTFVDQACQLLVRNLPGPGPASTAVPDRPKLVRALLSDEPLDLAQAASALSYPLAAHHVGLVAAPLAEPADVRRALGRLIEAAGCSALVLPTGEGSWWAWLGWRANPPEPERLAQIASTSLPGVLVGMGEPGEGRDGFRRTHEQAAQAQRTGQVVRGATATVLRHRDVELASLLCAAPERARRFAADRLGPLAARDPASERLRSTIRAYLALGRGRTKVADALGVHQKTVSYRIARIEQLLGHSLEEHTLELETALLIDAMLEPEPGGPTRGIV